MIHKKIKNNSNTKEKEIILELSIEELEDILKNNKDKHLIIKFGATWCGPCQKVEPLLKECFTEMPDNVLCFNLDVDDNYELFGKLKSKKSVSTIPAILYYNCNLERSKWYISDKCIFDSDPAKILKFFQDIYQENL